MWLVNGSARSARWTTASWPSARGRQHLVPDDQSPLSSVASSGRVAPCSGRPGGDRAPVRSAQLGRAGLQAGEAGIGLGGLHGAQRSSDPPPLELGLLCVLVLLAGLVRGGGRHRPSLRTTYPSRGWSNKLPLVVLLLYAVAHSNAYFQAP